MPARRGDALMLPRTNGAYEHREDARLKRLALSGYWNGALAVLLIVWTAALALSSSGWLILPAKDSDLQKVAESLSTIKADLGHIGTDLHTLADSIRSSREDIIYLKAMLDERKRGKTSAFKTTLER